MSEGYSILVDTSKCTACRGCQIACKQWNELPATATKNWGSYQNPQDLSADTWKLVRFADGSNGDGKPLLVFFHRSVQALPVPWMHGVPQRRMKSFRTKKPERFSSRQRLRTLTLRPRWRGVHTTSLGRTRKPKSCSNAPCALTESRITRFRHA